MRIKNEGFTLVEVIATMTILGIIMLLAIPNITGVIEKQRAKTYVEDAKKMIALAKYKVAKGDTNTSWTLEELDSSHDIEKGPYGYSYKADESKVFYNNGTYSVILIENISGTYSGILEQAEESSLYNNNDLSQLIKKDVVRGSAVGGDTINGDTYTNENNNSYDSSGTNPYSNNTGTNTDPYYNNSNNTY